MIDLTPLDVRKKKGDFAKSMRGYEPGPVDPHNLCRLERRRRRSGGGWRTGVGVDQPAAAEEPPEPPRVLGTEVVEHVGLAAVLKRRRGTAHRHGLAGVRSRGLAVELRQHFVERTAT